MEEQKTQKDYTSGYDVPEQQETNSFIEYGKKEPEIPSEHRTPGMEGVQRTLGILCAAVGLVFLLSFLIPSFNAVMHRLSPWNALVPASLFVFSLFVAKAGENRPMQLFLISACVPAYHYLTVWFLCLPGSMLQTILLAVLFLILGASLVFALDRRLLGKNEFPLILVILPMYVLAFSFSAGYAEYAPGWYLNLMAVAQGAILLNAAISAVKALWNDRKSST